MSAWLVCVGSTTNAPPHTGHGSPALRVFSSAMNRLLDASDARALPRELDEDRVDRHVGAVFVLDGVDRNRALVLRREHGDARIAGRTRQPHEPVGRELAFGFVARPADPQVAGIGAAPADRTAFGVDRVAHERVLPAGVELVEFHVDGFGARVAAGRAGRDRELDGEDIIREDPLTDAPGKERPRVADDGVVADALDVVVELRAAHPHGPGDLDIAPQLQNADGFLERRILDGEAVPRDGRERRDRGADGGPGGVDQFGRGQVAIPAGEDAVSKSGHGRSLLESMNVPTALAADLERAQAARDDVRAFLVRRVALGTPRRKGNALEELEGRPDAARPVGLGGADAGRVALRAERRRAGDELAGAGTLNALLEPLVTDRLRHAGGVVLGARARARFPVLAGLLDAAFVVAGGGRRAPDELLRERRGVFDPNGHAAAPGSPERVLHRVNCGKPVRPCGTAQSVSD